MNPLQLLDILKSYFEKEYSSDFTSISFNDIKNVYTNMKNVDPEIRDYLLVLMEELIKYS